MAGGHREDGGEHRTVLDRADRLLRAFDAQHQSLSLAGIAARAGLPRTTTYRTAEQMVKLGWLSRAAGRYVIGNGLFEIATLVPIRTQLREAAMPFMQDLYETAHETVHLAVRDGLDVLYVEKIGGHARATEASRIGGRLPLYATGVGRALLAYSAAPLLDRVLDSGLRRFTDATCATPDELRAELDATRRRGVAVERGEYDPSVCCVAAPIFGPTGLAAAISVTGIKDQIQPERLSYAVRVAALGVSRELGHGHGQSVPAAR